MLFPGAASTQQHGLTFHLRAPPPLSLCPDVSWKESQLQLWWKPRQDLAFCEHERATRSVSLETLVT